MGWRIRENGKRLEKAKRKGGWRLIKIMDCCWEVMMLNSLNKWWSNYCYFRRQDEMARGHIWEKSEINDYFNYSDWSIVDSDRSTDLFEEET